MTDPTHTLSRSSSARLKEFQTALREAGLGLVAVMSPDQLPPETAQFIEQAGARTGLVPAQGDLRIVVIGNAGGGFWNRLSNEERNALDPLDEYSLSRIEHALQPLAGLGEYRIIYPGEVCTK